MATSNLRPISSLDEQSLWYIISQGYSAVASVFTGQTFSAGQYVIVGSTTANTSVVFYETTSSASPLGTLTFTYDGETQGFLFTKNVQVVSVSNDRGRSSIVSIVKEKTETANNAELITITSTTNTLSLSGSGYALIVGGGGGGGGSALAFQGTMLGLGGGGGSGGVRVEYFNNLSTITSATIGGGGGGGTSSFNSGITSGGSGGATTFGGFTANGGGGGTYGGGFPFASPGAAGAAGTPGGAAGASGGIFSGNSAGAAFGTRGFVSSISLAANASITGGARRHGNGDAGQTAWETNALPGFRKNYIASIGDSGDGFTGANGYGAGGNSGGAYRTSVNGGYFTGAWSGLSGVVVIMKGV